MIKLFLMVGIVVCCALIGAVIKNYLYVRAEIFKDFNGLCKSISNEISFLKTDKFTILKNNGDLSKQSKVIIDDYVVLGKADSIFLKNYENKAINDLLSSIGKKDVDGELNNLTYHQNLMENYHKKNEDIYVKYGVFSIKISIIIGALIVIFLI